MEFLHFFTGVLWDNGFKPIIDAFETKYPTIKWRGTAIPYGEMHTKIVTLVAGGTPPDGMSVPSDRAPELILRRVLRESNSYLMIASGGSGPRRSARLGERRAARGARAHLGRATGYSTRTNVPSC